MTRSAIVLLSFALLLLTGCVENAVFQPSPPGHAPAGERAHPTTKAQDPLLGPIEPVAIDLRRIPVNASRGSKPVPQPKSRQRPRLPISDEMADNLRAASRFLPPNPNIQRQANLAARAPTNDSDFDAIDGTDNVGGSSVPPDSELAVGPTHAIVVVNSMFAIYNKTTGALLAGPTDFDAFFTGVSGCSGTFDPNVLYDESADRFILGIDGDGTAYCVAASTSGDPTSTWSAYGFSTIEDPGDFFDYPHAGVGEDAIFMGANLFAAVFRAEVWAMNKSQMYAGTALSVVKRELGGSADTPQPMNLHGFGQGTWPSTGVHYILGDGVFDGTTIGVWSWEDPFGSDTFINEGTVNLNSFTGVTGGFPLDVPQGGGGDDVQGNDWRVQDAEYRNGNLWMTHTIACNPGAGSVNCFRWAEIDPTGPSIVQAGVFGTDGEFRTFADLAVNHCEDVTIGYSKSSTSIFPGVFYTGRLGTDTANTLGAEAELIAGEIVYTAFDDVPRRWGDYSGATSDPDGERTWYLGEYSKDVAGAAPWGERVGEFSTSCDAPDFIFADGFESGDTAAWTSSVGE